MSQYDFTLRVTVDDADLTRHNKEATSTRAGIQVPADPAEWDEDELLIALNEEVATAKVLDSSGPQ